MVGTGASKIGRLGFEVYNVLYTLYSELRGIPFVECPFSDADRELSVAEVTSINYVS